MHNNSTKYTYTSLKDKKIYTKKKIPKYMQYEYANQTKSNKYKVGVMIMILNVICIDW